MKFETLEYFESLTDKELTDIAIMEAMWIVGKHKVRPECRDEVRVKQADLYAALVNRVAKYNPEIQQRVKVEE